MSREAFLENLPLVRFKDVASSFRIRQVVVGAGKPVIVAGPCAVESGEQILQVAQYIKERGAQGLRGGVFKPRSSPYSFQGLGEEGLKLLAEAREQTGLFTVVEVTAIDQIGLVAEHADVLQIGSRNMQNFELLKAVGRSRKPVLLKRGLSATIQELLQAAEYILVEGNTQVILCERGIRTFETMTRNTLDINAIPLLKQLTHLPIFADPSHGTGRSELVVPVAKAAISAGVDGLIIEVHPNPAAALSDGHQSLDFHQFQVLMEGINPADPLLSAHNPNPLHYPISLTEFQQRQKDGYRFIPIMGELFNDTETPVTLFAKLTAAEQKGRFLLESVERGEQVGRYSFVGWDPLFMITAKGDLTVIQSQADEREIAHSDPLREVQKLLNEMRVAPIPVDIPMYGGAVGYLGYDYARLIERLPARNEPAEEPDLCWMIPRYLACFDHVLHKIRLIKLVDTATSAAEDGLYQSALADLDQVAEQLQQPLVLNAMPNHETDHSAGEHLFSTQQEYEAGVERIKEYIRAGDAFQVVLSQRVEREYRNDPFLFYRALRTVNPSPYLFYFDFGRFQLAGSSPEVMVRKEASLVTLKPIAGTRRRGATVQEDEKLKQELMADAKERAEHVMLVDLGRNDLGRVCRFGSVKVTDLMSVENYSHVIHIVSEIQGELLPEYTGVELLRAVFPAGTLSGAPKIRAMEIIDELEPVSRGFYGGAVGYLGFNGNLDTCITIRTVFFREQKAIFQVGAGIVADSIPAAEYQETMNKAGALLTALAKVGG